MAFVSTRGESPPVSLRTALFAGLAPDGGLYVPQRLDPLAVAGWRGASLPELGAEMLAVLAGNDLPQKDLKRLVGEALDFPIPLVPVDDHTCALELFHGPTFAFKDVGARVMARLMASLNDRDESLTVLVATSGDTGSAVAHAFFGVAGTHVVILFPDGQVTPIQEAQFTTLGGNVTAIAVTGSFDDCQRLAKQAFADDELRTRRHLTSANSINIGRLLPQMFYYVHGALQLDQPPVFSVPSGNFGNLTAGLLAWKLGAPIAHLIAATTINDTMPRYLETGRYEPRPSVSTLANAMDVGDPSNVERIRWLFQDDVTALRALVTASVHTDADVRRAIRDIDGCHGYLCDPHTAIACLGMAAVGSTPFADSPRVFLATAHPAKFRDIVEPIVGRPVPLPAALAAALVRPRYVQHMKPRLSELRELLLD